MKKVLMLTLGLMVFAVLVAVNPAGARGMMGAGGPGGGMMGPGGFGGGCCGTDGTAALEKLNLSAEQTAKVASLREEQFKQVTPIKEKMFSKRNELKQLWLQATPDQAKITAVQKEMREFRDQMQDKMTAYKLEINKVLTPEQRDKVRAGFGAGSGPGSRWGGRCKAEGGPGPEGKPAKSGGRFLKG